MILDAFFRETKFSCLNMIQYEQLSTTWHSLAYHLFRSQLQYLQGIFLIMLNTVFPYNWSCIRHHSRQFSTGTYHNITSAPPFEWVTQRKIKSMLTHFMYGYEEARGSECNNSATERPLFAQCGNTTQLQRLNYRRVAARGE